MAENVATNNTARSISPAPPRGLRSLTLLALSGVLVLLSSVNLAYIEPNCDLPKLARLCNQFAESFPSLEFSPFLLCASAGLYALLERVYGSTRRWHFSNAILGLFFGFAMTFGWAFDQLGYNWAVVIDGRMQLFKTCLHFLSWSCIGYICTIALFGWLDRKNTYCPINNSRVLSAPFVGRALRLFNAKPFTTTVFTLAIFWLPVIIGYAPALFVHDVNAQASMWLGLANSRASAVALIDENVTMTTHFPVLHTLLLGISIEIGKLLNNANAGILIYTLGQSAFVITCFAYGMSILRSFGISLYLRAAVVCLLVLSPWYSEYAVLVSKDTIFGCAVLVMCLQLLQLLAGSRTKHGYVVLTIAALLVTFFRSGGMLFSAVGLLSVFVLYSRSLKRKKRFQKELLLCFLTIIATYTLATFIIQPALHITPGNKIEALSVPVQQVARFAKEHPDEIGEQEAAAIDAVLVLDGLADRYNPALSDPVKDFAARNRHGVTTDQWMQFFKAWLSLGKKHPECYFAATASNYYGYFYISKERNQYYGLSNSANAMEIVSKTTEMDFHPAQNELSVSLANFNSAYAELFRRIPFLSLCMNSAFWDWLLILATAYALRRRKTLAAPVLCALVAVMLVFLIGPTNGSYYNRYVFPLAVTLPYVLPVLLASRDCPCGAGAAQAGPAEEEA